VPTVTDIGGLLREIDTWSIGTGLAQPDYFPTLNGYLKILF